MVEPDTVCYNPNQFVVLKSVKDRLHAKQRRQCHLKSGARASFTLNDILKPHHQTRRDCRKDVTFFAQPPVCYVQRKKKKKN